MVDTLEVSNHSFESGGIGILFSRLFPSTKVCDFKRAPVLSAEQAFPEA